MCVVIGTLVEVGGLVGNLRPLGYGVLFGKDGNAAWTSDPPGRHEEEDIRHVGFCLGMMGPRDAWRVYE